MRNRDAMYLKVREGGRIVSKALLVAFCVNEDGEREVLGVSRIQRALGLAAAMLGPSRSPDSRPPGPRYANR